MRSILLLCLLLLGSTPAFAGVFNLPTFVQPGKTAFGVEPEATFSNGGGFGVNGKFQYGLDDLSNLTFTVGSGGGVRKFRIGGAMTFDFFPDTADQPGIGFAAQVFYYEYKYDYHQLEATFVPYLHKLFRNGKGNNVDPFISIPVGPSFRSDNTDFMATLVVGAIFHETGSKFSFVGEVGVKLANSESYGSGGVIFAP